MKKRWILAVSALTVAVLLVVVVLSLRSGARQGDSSKSAAGAAGSSVTATVQVAPLKQETIRETITAYGSVIAAPGKSDTYNVPFECIVQKVHIAAGEVVEKGQILLTVNASPDTRLAFQEAQDELETAQNQLKLTKELADLKLATRQNLLEAEQRVKAAELKVKNFTERGVGKPRELRANRHGIVNMLKVQQGAIVAAGDVLAETIAEDDIQVRLGIESEDVGFLEEGQTVRLDPVNGPPGDTLGGTIVRITRRVNPDTRLVDVFITPMDESRLLLNDYVRGDVVIASAEGLVVPRAAVLPMEGSHVLFTVEKGHAVRHKVTVGVENDDQVQVFGDGLEAGQPVIVVGNSEVDDGMAVKVEAAS